jgi:hypothetical protein
MEGTVAVVITRLDVLAAELREAAARTQDAKAARRMSTLMTKQEKLGTN